ncbi:hypothetical protein [Pseudomonas sp. WHRI 8519]|uniref:hypothetical protein n=1 Tax=Pseudomonas sp. WHRI 8519 TaxID=3162567 RepID=UPI0032EFA7D9
MSKATQSLSLKDLPKVFEREPGEINISLLKQICSVWPKSSSNIRGIIESFTGEKLKPKDDTYIFLSNFVFLAEFRKTWEDSKKSGFPTFDRLVYLYVTHKHKNLHFDASELVDFYEKRDCKVSKAKKSYPILTKIGLFTEQLCSTSVDPVSSALLAWSMFESCTLNLFESPRETSLQNFEEALLADLAKNKQSEILDLLSTGSWKKPLEVSKTKASIAESSIANIQKPENPEDIEFVKHTHPLQEELSADILEAKEAISKIKSYSENVAQKATILMSSHNAKSIADGIHESAESISALIEVVDSRRQSIIEKLNTPLRLGYAALDLPDPPSIASSFCMNGFNDWIQIVNSAKEDVSQKIEKLNLILSKSEKTIRELVMHKEVWGPSPSGDDILDTLAKSADIIERGIQAESYLYDAVQEKYYDLEWNPLSDKSLSHVWKQFGLLIIRRANINDLMGICVRKEFELLLQPFSDLVASLVKDYKKDEIPKVISAASWLTLGQKEEIARNNENCIAVIAMAQLHGYLNSDQISHIDRYSYWSAYPLHDLISNPVDLFGDFFSSLYICTTEPGSEVDLRFLVQQVAKAVITNSEKKNATSPEVEMQNRLLNVLERHQKGGSNTYSHIWNAAYNDIFLPLYNIAEDKGASEFAKTYQEFVNNFEIENHLASWKQEIPEHLKKRSEYDKFIRNQVSIKISELNDWLSLYVTSTSKKSNCKAPRHEQLVKTICLILESSDTEALLLKSWLLDLHVQKEHVKYPCFERSLEGSFGTSFEADDVSAFYPRAFCENLEHGIVTYASIIGDTIISEAGFNTHSQLIKLYADKQFFEAFAALVSESNEEVPPSIERIVERNIEEIEAAQQAKISLLKQRVDALTSSFNDLTNSIKKSEELLNTQQWKKLEKELADAEQYLYLAESEDLEAREREAVAARIIKLGRTPGPNDSISSLRSLLNALIKENQPRRLHIEQISKLSRVKNLDELLLNKVTSCVSQLDDRLPYPDAQTSDLLAYYFQQAVDPLSLELGRIRTLLPSYGKKLKLLTFNFLHNIVTNESSLDENSNLVSALIDTAEMWKELGILGESCVDDILRVFDSKGLDAKNYSEIDVFPVSSNPPEKSQSVIVEKNKEDEDEERNTVQLDQLVKKAKALATHRPKHQSSSTSLDELVKMRNWEDASYIALNGMLVEHPEHSAGWLESLADWSVSSLLGNKIKFNVAEYSACLYLINNIKGSTVVKAITPTKNMKGMIGEFACDFLTLMLHEASGDAESNAKATTSEKLQSVSNNTDLLSQFAKEFRFAFTLKDNGDTATTRGIWDYFSGDSRQAEARASFMNIAWRLHAPAVTAACLAYSPIDMDRRRASALAEISHKALVDGKHELLQGFVDLRKSIQAKPFQVFVEMVMRRAPIHIETQAKLSMAGSLEFIADGVLRGTLNITPRKVDCPDLIEITLNPTAPIRFKGGALKWDLVGPFFSETSRPIEFEQLDKNAEQFRLDVDCESTSLTGVRSKFTQSLYLKVAGREIFEPLSPDFIDEAFDSFPEQQMRYDAYVSRADDEQKIEKALFNSKVVRSLWISSPRRSGKTSMLYRILDAFSHKVGRDNFVIYLTIDESFSSGLEFNKWIWKRTCSILANKELRDLYNDFDSMGRSLTFDADAGTFIGQLSDILISNCTQGSRVIFLIDEIDRFAAMYFEGGSRKKLATDILWQIRHLIAERRDIGIVFAGSSAAREIFISNPESPFYNSIEHLELSPFSCKTKQQETSSRQIIEPGQIRYRHVIPKESLEHLIWVCSGIPYYMKLVAGATFAVATQSHILVSDINSGLRALLSKNTKISKLDDMGGDPGADDLRTTVTLERNSDGVLVRAVLYAVADLHSPISGHRVLRGRITSKESKLSKQYRIPKELIERGIEICLKLGLLRLSASASAQELFFAIPILGESLRNSSARHWALIDHELSAISPNTLEGAKQ